MFIRKSKYEELKRLSILKETQGYKLVYQGGHHDVYCNGTHHLKTRGGKVSVGGKINELEELRRELIKTRYACKGEALSCDCEKYA